MIYFSGNALFFRYGISRFIHQMIKIIWFGLLYRLPFSYVTSGFDFVCIGSQSRCRVYYSKNNIRPYPSTSFYQVFFGRLSNHCSILPYLHTDIHIYLKNSISLYSYLMSRIETTIRKHTMHLNTMFIWISQGRIVLFYVLCVRNEIRISYKNQTCVY